MKECGLLIGRPVYILVKCPITICGKNSCIILNLFHYDKLSNLFRFVLMECYLYPAIVPAFSCQYLANPEGKKVFILEL